MKTFLLISFYFLLVSCSMSEDRQELVDSIRGVGSQAFYQDKQKAFWTLEELSQLDDTAEINISSLFLVPKDSTFDVTVFEDDPLQSGAVFNLASQDFSPIETSKIKEDDFSKTPFLLYQVSSKISGKALFQKLMALRPDLNPERASFQLSSVLKIRYGFQISLKGVSEGTKKEERLVGDIMVGTKDLLLYENSLTPSIIALDSLKETYKRSEIKEELVTINSKEEKVKPVLLKADLSKIEEKPGEEDPNKRDKRKIHWFISGGKVESFRATETRWFLPEKEGPYLVLLGVYGIRSRVFTYEYKIVTVE